MPRSISEIIAARANEDCVTVYVPATEKASKFLSGVVRPGSALAGRGPMLPFVSYPPVGPSVMITLYYEGATVHGDGNPLTSSLRERFIVGAGRLTHRRATRDGGIVRGYPTSAMIGQHESDILPVGIFDARLGVMARLDAPDILRDWAAKDPRQVFDVDRLGQNGIINLGRLVADRDPDYEPLPSLQEGAPGSALAGLGSSSTMVTAMLDPRLEDEIEEAAQAYENLGLPLAAYAIRRDVGEPVARWRAEHRSAPRP